MYAVIRAGGKQYTVRPGDKVRVERTAHELGSEFDMDEVLLVGGDQVHIGNPTLKGAKVTVVVVQQDKAPKVIVFKKKRRQGYRRLKGHRQFFTELFVKSIHSPSGESSEAEGKAHVIDSAKIAERKANAKTAKPKVTKKARKEAPAPKKAVAKKAAPKAAAKKKSAAKKTAKKKTAKKKTAKK